MHVLLLREEPIAYDAHAFALEVEAEIALKAMLRPHFALRKQVHMRHWSGWLGRIDFMGVALCDFPIDWFGIEAKRTYSQFNEFTKGVRQAISYRQSVIEEKKLPNLAGTRFPIVLLWPTPSGYGGWEANGGVGGVMRLAGQYNVGAIVTRYGEPRFIGCGGQLWWSPSTGPTKLLNEIASNIDRGWEPR